jgi:outer membrane protein W
MKKFKVLAAVLFCALGVYAQDNTSSTGGSSSSGDFQPSAGDISGAILFGRGNFLNTGLDVPGVSSSWISTPVTGSSPYANTVDPNENSASNIVGIEGRYFLTDNIALKLSGGSIIRNTPARPNVPGFIESSSDPGTWIPAYASVEADNRVDVNLNIGGEYHFTSQYSRLFPYVGATVPYYYARRSMYDPTIQEESGSGGDPGTPTVVDVGVRSVEIIGFGLQAVGGVDYYLMEGLYLGIETKPISYVYAYSNKIPAPGLETLSADTHTWSFFSQTFIKLGFRF